MKLKVLSFINSRRETLGEKKMLTLFYTRTEETSIKSNFTGLYRKMGKSLFKHITLLKKFCFKRENHCNPSRREIRKVIRKILTAGTDTLRMKSDI